MSSFGKIEKLMDSYDPVRSRLAETQKLVEKWEPTGLLEGLAGEHILSTHLPQVCSQSNRSHQPELLHNRGCCW